MHSKKLAVLLPPFFVQKWNIQESMSFCMRHCFAGKLVERLNGEHLLWCSPHVQEVSQNGDHTKSSSFSKTNHLKVYHYSSHLFHIYFILPTQKFCPAAPRATCYHHPQASPKSCPSSFAATRRASQQLSSWSGWPCRQGCFKKTTHGGFAPKLTMAKRLQLFGIAYLVRENKPFKLLFRVHWLSEKRTRIF